MCLHSKRTCLSNHLHVSHKCLRLTRQRRNSSRLCLSNSKLTGLRVDWLKDFLQAILSPEDCKKHSARLEPPPKKEETTIYQDMPNKVKEHGEILEKYEHQRNVVRDAEAKLHKQQGLLQELLERSQSLKQEIDTLQAQVAAAANSSQVVPRCLPRATLQMVAPQLLIP